MAICKECNQEMIGADGCVACRIKYSDGTKLLSIPHDDPDESCGDCGAKYGFYHHAMCDQERCPRCGGQFISCGCK